MQLVQYREHEPGHWVCTSYWITVQCSKKFSRMLLPRIAGGKLGWSGNLRHKQSAHVHNAYYNGPLNCQLHNSTPVKYFCIQN
ncbi:hypothetical protein MGG_18018 [Pyricularia oryzae 70-15]|uniref:Uncharacterized protein n=2 Tax=Pyricularia oryzae TaxID=318829 RepID=G4NJP3_PYRO7|nr:uncharacterized protein MGG_18018 [Pyricularia oryzae 70-15]EHA46459.1 hypothetical protein MGG_18018 [Pyricularia oryzae 70-15]ELQ36365.1 hypothetical protein OOU_Y34scaffold00666g226 [Pyricularia oryzae Y34]